MRGRQSGKVRETFVRTAVSVKISSTTLIIIIIIIRNLYSAIMPIGGHRGATIILFREGHTVTKHLTYGHTIGSKYTVANYRHGLCKLSYFGQKFEVYDVPTSAVTKQCVIHIPLIRTIVSHFTAAGSSVYLAALDIRKAFDSVHHDKMFDSLISTGVPDVIVNIIRHWYSILRVNVRWGSRCSQFFYCVQWCPPR